jgi:hypothetical protein
MAQDPSEAVKAPGKAPSNGQYGSSTSAQPKGRGSARDLNVK